jgi:hypothetical protein
MRHIAARNKETCALGTSKQRNTALLTSMTLYNV